LTTVQVRLTTEAGGVPPEQVARMTSTLRADVLAFGALSAEHPQAAEPAPSGAKGSALEWAQLVVTLAGNLPALATFVRGWARDHRGARVRLEVDGDVIELDGATDPESHQLLERFLARHRE
jgi:Effector Associated Constant Component 1